MLPEDEFPYQAFWHLRRGQEQIRYAEIVEYAAHNGYDDEEELVAIVFALDDVFEKHLESKRSKQGKGNGK